MTYSLSRSDLDRMTSVIALTVGKNTNKGCESANFNIADSDGLVCRFRIYSEWRAHKCSLYIIEHRKAGVKATVSNYYGRICGLDVGPDAVRMSFGTENDITVEAVL